MNHFVRDERIMPVEFYFNSGYCRETKETFIIKVPDRSEATLLLLIYQWISPETIENPSIVMSDKWWSFQNIDEDARYEHDEVNHKHHFVDLYSGAHTQHIYRVCGAVKEGNKRRRGTHLEFIDSYLAQYIWQQRLNVRDLTEVIFQDIAAF